MIQAEISEISTRSWWKSDDGAGKVILVRVIGRDHLPSWIEEGDGGRAGGLSAAVTIEPVIESHLFLLPDEVKRPNETPDPKSDQLFSQSRPRAALFLPGLRHAHTLLFVRPFLCGSILLRTPCILRFRYDRRYNRNGVARLNFYGLSASVTREMFHH